VDRNSRQAAETIDVVHFRIQSELLAMEEFESWLRFRIMEEELLKLIYSGTRLAVLEKN